MDDSFAFRTTVPLRRQVDPTIVRLAVFLTLLVLGVGLFSSWVVASERDSFSRARPRVASSADPAEATVAGLDDAAAASATDAEAEEATRVALAAARATFGEHGTFLDAGTAALNAVEPGYIFVDGPSTLPKVVSVATGRDLWAAAVLGPSGICHWIRADLAGTVVAGTSLECTGGYALHAPAAGR
jgi:hypothetical protein